MESICVNLIPHLSSGHFHNLHITLLTSKWTGSNCLKNWWFGNKTKAVRGNLSRLYGTKMCIYIVPEDRNKIRSRLIVQICLFLRLTVQNPFFRDKVPYFNVLGQFNNSLWLCLARSLALSGSLCGSISLSLSLSLSLMICSQGPCSAHTLLRSEYQIAIHIQFDISCWSNLMGWRSKSVKIIHVQVLEVATFCKCITRFKVSRAASLILPLRVAPTQRNKHEYVQDVQTHPLQKYTRHIRCIYAMHFIFTGYDVFANKLTILNN